jgi:hypothetical protein
MRRHACLLLACLGAFASCTWRQSLLTAHDAGRADSQIPDAPPSVDLPADLPLALDAPLTVDAPSVCWGRPKVDAGSGLNDGLLVWYKCDSLAGTSLRDSSGRGNDGTLASASGSAATVVTGKVGNAIELQFDNKGYVSMPPGLLAKACEVTVATWVYVNSNADAWPRIWDFGMDTNRYMFLTPITNTDDVARFGITTNGNQHEENLKPKTPVPNQRWTHVAVVLGPSGGTLFFDGEAVANDETMVLRPADLGSTVHNFIGRSDFADDPYLDAAIDEFRVYDRALTPSEIKALAAGS